MNNLKENILNCLQSRAGEFISGAELSGAFEVTRAAVWKQVEALRREGYSIGARPHRGYRLEGVPDRLDEALLSTEKQIYFYPAVDSTNSMARRLAEEGKPCGTVVIAEEQRLGRGRLGRSWVSPPGKGLWFSMLLRPPALPPAAVSPVTLVAAAALAERLTEETGLTVQVKWPNDLLVNGKKTAGILTELKGEPDRIDYLIIGAGLNVNHEQGDFPPDLQATAGSIYLAAGRTFNRTALFLSLRARLAEACRLFFEQGFAPFLPLWKEHNVTLGERVTVAWPGGSIRGTALDLDRSGALLLRDSAGEIHRINYGEIVWPENAEIGNQKL